MMGSRRRAGNRLKEMARQGNMSIKPDPRHVEQTACLAEDEFQAASLREKPMRFPAFVLRQIRYAGRYVFGLQAVLLLLILTVFYYVSIRWDLREPGIFWYLYRRIPLLLCGAGVMAAWSCVPVLSRSYRWKMAEVEAAACSQIRLRMAWLCIGGGSAISTGAAAAAAAWKLWTVSLGVRAAYLILPFLLAGNGILFLAARCKDRRFFIDGTVALTAGFLVFALAWSEVSEGMDSVQDIAVSAVSVWTLCIGAVCLCVLQIQRIRRKELDGWNYVSRI